MSTAVDDHVSQAVRPNRSLAAAEELSADPPTAHQRRDVQGLRGIAVLLVVLYHAEVIVRGGFVGVDVFFVISGFVITMSLLRELESRDRIDFRAFYSRRIKRLLPALALTLVVVAVMSVFVVSPFGPQLTAAKTGIAASLFSSNVFLYLSPSGYFDAPAAANPLLHMWSLSVEEQFYVAYPLVLAGSWKVISRMILNPRNYRRALAASLAGFGVLSLMLCVALTQVSGPLLGIAEPRRLAFYAPFTRAWEFIAGGLIALAGPRLLRAGRPAAQAFAGIGLALVGVSALLYSDTTVFPGITALVPVIGTVLLIVSGSMATGSLQRAIGHRWLVWMGDLSYGWYLWHWPFIVGARLLIPGNRLVLVVAAFASLLPTIASYRWLENRIRYSRSINGWRVVAVAALCVVIPLAGFVGLRSGTQSGWKSASLTDAQAQLGLHIDEVRGCNTLASLDSPACRWDPTSTPIGTVALVGDSNAGHFTEGVIDAANQLGYSVIVSTSSGCPFVDLEVGRPEIGFDGWCPTNVSAVTDRLIAMRPSAVIVASASDRYLEEASALRRTGTTTEAVSDEDKAAMWADGLSAVLSRMTNAGIPVAVVHPTPRFDGFNPELECSTLAALRDITSCGSERAQTDVFAERRLAVTAEQAAVSEAGSTAASNDPAQVLCPTDTCSTLDGTTWMFRDDAHISIPGSRALTPTFKQALTSLLS